MSDLLRLNHINNLPQPIIAVLLGEGRYPVNDIDVETGLLRIDVVGKLQLIHISEVWYFLDATGQTHSVDSFYLEE